MVVACIEQEQSFSGCPPQGWYHNEGDKPTCPRPKPIEKREDLMNEKQKRKKKKKKPKKVSRVARNDS
jgi:hypothetical protein